MNTNYHVRIGLGKSALLALAGIVCLASTVKQASAATIYSESTNSTTGSPISAFGWSAYRQDGTNLSNTTTDPLQITAPNLLIGSGFANTGGRYALFSDAPTINPAAYLSDLTIAISQNATDESTASPDMGWRVLVEVSSAWYASTFAQYTSSTSTISANPSDSIWHVWTGETDFTNGFNIGSISGTAAALPGGSITGVGVLAIDGAQNNDRMRLFSLQITATPVPEPTSLAMLALV